MLPIAALVSGCKKDAGAAGDAATEAPPPAPVAVVDAGPPAVSSIRPLAGTATRRGLTRWSDEPSLEKQAAPLLSHFGTDAGAPGFVVHTAPVVPGRAATLVTRGDGSDPMVLFTDGDRLLWTKEAPTGGVLPPALELTLSAHSALGVALLAWVPSAKVVIARVWADDSNAFGDFELLHAERCDDVAAAYVPGQGISVFAATPAGVVYQLLDENNVNARPRTGDVVAPPSRGPAPLALAMDGSAVWLASYATAKSPTSELLRVDRYQKGKSTLSSPVEIEIPKSTSPAARPTIVAEGADAGEGAIRVPLDRGAVGSHATAVRIDRSGAVTRL